MRCEKERQSHVAKNGLMKQDIKNVIITFGLIATALVSGSFLYRKKIETEYLLAVKQEQLQNLINEQQAIADLRGQEVAPETVPDVPKNSTQTLAPSPPVKSKQQSVPAPKAKPPTQQPQPVVQTTPVVNTPAPTPPKPQVVIKPTRKSRAS